MSRAHLLLVDDDVEFLDPLGEYLRSQGYQVTAVDSGSTALQALKAVQPDLVLLDLWMPEMDGLTTLKGLLAVDPKLPVVMVTGNDDQTMTAFALTAGACDYVPKPVNFAYLDSVLNVQLAALAPRGDVLELTADDAALGVDLAAYAASLKQPH